MCITEDFLLDCVHHKESRKIILIFLTSDAKELNKNILGQGHFNSTSHKIYLIQKVRRLRNILSNMKSIIGCSNTFQISGISTLKTQSNPALWTPGLYGYLIVTESLRCPWGKKACTFSPKFN